MSWDACSFTKSPWIPSLFTEKRNYKFIFKMISFQDACHKQSWYRLAYADRMHSKMKLFLQILKIWSVKKLLLQPSSNLHHSATKLHRNTKTTVLNSWKSLLRISLDEKLILEILKNVPFFTWLPWQPFWKFKRLLWRKNSIFQYSYQICITCIWEDMCYIWVNMSYL